MLHPRRPLVQLLKLVCIWQQAAAPAAVAAAATAASVSAAQPAGMSVSQVSPLIMAATISTDVCCMHQDAHGIHEGTRISHHSRGAGELKHF